MTVHVALGVEVEVPPGTGGRGRLERGPEDIAVLPVHLPVAVRVAKQPEEGVHLVATGQAVPIAVERPPPAVLNLVRLDRERVTAVRQRTANDIRAGEGEHSYRLTVHH